VKRDCYPDNKPFSLPIFIGKDQQARKIAYGGAEDEQKTEVPIPLRIKIVAGDNEHHFFSSKMPIERGHGCCDDEKKQQKTERREQHRDQPVARKESSEFTADIITSAFPADSEPWVVSAPLIAGKLPRPDRQISAQREA
jgi:hypothetical protein